MTRKPKLWSASLVASVRQALACLPYIQRANYREWAWGFGSIYTKTPQREATCCACGDAIHPGEDAFYVVYTETKQGPWCPEERYLHRLDCLSEAASPDVKDIDTGNRD